MILVTVEFFGKRKQAPGIRYQMVDTFVVEEPFSEENLSLAMQEEYKQVGFVKILYREDLDK